MDKLINNDNDPLSPYNIIEIVLKQYREASGKYEVLLEKVLQLSSLLKKLEDIPEYSDITRDLRDLQRELTIKINEINTVISSRFNIYDTELLKKWEQTEDTIESEFLQCKDSICTALQNHKKEIDERFDSNDNEVVNNLSYLQSELVNRDEKIEDLLKTLSNTMIKLRYKLNLTIAVLALVSVIGSGAMVYVKYATEKISAAKKEHVTNIHPENKELYIVDKYGTKIPIFIKEK